MKRSILFVLASISVSFSQVVTEVNFENRAEGQYTDSLAKIDFPKREGASSWYAMEKNNGENSKIIYDGPEHGMVLQLKYPKGCVGPNDSDSAKACAGQIKQPLPQTGEEMWVAYDILFEEGFEFVLGGKLPGLCGGACYTGGNRPSTGDGWSARIMWRKEGYVVQYLYFVEQASIYGDDALWNLGEAIPQKQFIPGKWHRVITKIKLNSVQTEGIGDKNGIIQSWFDGELSLNIDTLRLRDYADQKIDVFYLSTFHGGSTTDWAPQKDVFVRYDNFKISLDSIPVTNSFSDEDSNPIFTSLPKNSIEKIYIYRVDGSQIGQKKDFLDINTHKLKNGKNVKIVR